MNLKEPNLICIDISAVIVQPEPMGPGFQTHVEGNSTQWSRGDNVYEAIGSLICRLALEHNGANDKRFKLVKGGSK